MAKMEAFTFMAALLSVGLSAILYLSCVALLRRQRVAVGVGASSAVAEPRYSFWDPGRFAIMVAVSGLVFLTFSIVARWIIT
ncbi:MAG: hypothetical protein Q7K03_11115, partial [Dehalococcoidia bacterium]|nr:hypothetical protein [Dehalococcoidia bacterium]